MKRIIVLMMAVFLAGGLVMAQQGRRGGKKPDPKVRAERMTERMAKEYSLNDVQKQQLLVANLALAEKMGDMPMRYGMGMNNNNQDSRAGKHHKGRKAGRKNARLTEEQRTKMQAEMQKKRAEMETAMTQYQAELQKIMTKDQYAAYTKNMQERKLRMESRRKDCPRE